MAVGSEWSVSHLLDKASLLGGNCGDLCKITNILEVPDAGFLSLKNMEVSGEIAEDSCLHISVLFL
jgi:hypothetical protein